MPIKAVVGSLLTKTYSIIDGLIYLDGSSNTHLSDISASGGWFVVPDTVNHPIVSLDNPISLPSSFEISYTGYTSQSIGGWNLLMVGASADCNQYNIGMLTNNGGFIRKGRDDCTLTNLITPSNVYNYGTEVSIKYQYSNGTHKLIINGNEFTTTNSEYAMNYFFGIGLGTNSKMKEIIVKPL